MGYFGNDFEMVEGVLVFFFGMSLIIIELN